MLTCVQAIGAVLIGTVIIYIACEVLDSLGEARAMNEKPKRVIGDDGELSEDFDTRKTHE